MTLPRAILIDPNDGCLTIARALVKRGVPVVALARHRSAYVAASRGVEGTVLPDLPTDEAAWIERLRELAERGDGVLIPGSDNAVELLVGHRSEIPARLRSFEGPDTPHLRIMDKAYQYRVAAEAGVRVPWMLSLDSHWELEDVLARADYPCVAKPAFKHIGEPLGYAVERADGPDELRCLCSEAIDLGVGMLVTEYVPGGEENLEGAVTVRTADGAYAVEYERHKVRQYPLDFGQGTLTKSAPVPETMAASKRLQEHIGFAGIASYEAKRHEETGERVLIELNVRVVQSFGLGQACGVDGPWRLYAALAGIPLPPQPAQRDGVCVVSPAFDFRAVRSRLRRRELTVGELVRSYRGTRDFSILDPRDPGPGLAFVRWAAGSKLAKRRARTGRAPVTKTYA